MSSEAPVRRRRVFYIPGYDPVPPRRYRELYRKEGAEQARISGHEIRIMPGHDDRRFAWHVEAEIEGASTSTDISVLVWSDIVKDSMDAGIVATYAQMLRTAAIYVGTGTLFRLTRLRKGPVIAALYPVGFLLLQLLLACLAAWAVGRLLVLWHPLAGWAGLFVVPVVLEGFRRLDGRLFVYYLMQDYAYSARHQGALPPELEERLSDFGDAIAAALAEDCDEVLVVGHSSGVHLGVSVLADLIRAGRVPPDRPALSFLSLGQVVPMVSFLPRAWRLRADLACLAARPEVFWLDVSAPGDVCAFALCDPVAVSGVAPEGRRWPVVISAAFSQTLGRNRWRALRWRFFRLHFQYLCAFDRPGDYDYFRITAGPRTLARRFRGRKPSASRIEKTASRYTSVAQ